MDGLRQPWYTCEKAVEQRLEAMDFVGLVLSVLPKVRLILMSQTFI